MNNAQNQVCKKDAKASPRKAHFRAFVVCEIDTGRDRTMRRNTAAMSEKKEANINRAMDSCMSVVVSWRLLKRRRQSELNFAGYPLVSGRSLFRAGVFPMTSPVIVYFPQGLERHLHAFLKVNTSEVAMIHPCP